MLLRKLWRLGASSQLVKVPSCRAFSTQDMNNKFEEFLSSINKNSPQKQQKEKIKVNTNLFANQQQNQSTVNQDELRFKQQARGHRFDTRTSPLEFESADMSSSEQEFKSIKREEIHPEAYYKEKDFNKFKQSLEDEINFKNSEQGKQYEEFVEVLTQRTRKIKEYSEEMLRQFKRPLSEKDILTQRLESMRDLAIELIVPKFGGKRFFTSELLKKVTKIEAFLKECVRELKVDQSEIKIYPGSSKGPNPQDDPEHYDAWWEENKPSVFKHPLYYELEERLEGEQKQFQDLLDFLKDQNQKLKNYREDITEEKIEIAQSFTIHTVCLRDTLYAGNDPLQDSPGAITRVHDDPFIFRKKSLTREEYQSLSLQERKIEEQPDQFHFASWRGSFEDTPLKFQLGLDTDINNLMFAKWSQIDNPVQHMKDFFQYMAIIERIGDVSDPLNYHEEQYIDPDTGHKVIKREPRKLVLTEMLDTMKKSKAPRGFITGGYYELLPSNIRSHILMRNAGIMCEFHHSQKTPREKEIVLNYVASLILPVKKEYEELMMENLGAKLPQFNEERAREMMIELENEDFDSDSDQIFDDDLHQDFIDLEFPEENYDWHFEQWQKRERLKGAKMVYDDMEKDEQGNFIGMPKGWRPSVYSPENLEFIDNPIKFAEKLEQEEEDEPTTEELVRAGELAVQKMSKLGIDILEVSSGSSSEDQLERAKRKDEKLIEAGYQYLAKYREEKRKQEEELEKFKLKQSIETPDEQLDFPIKPIKNPLVPEAPEVATPPIDFYDNEDGFWDEFIAEKRKRNFEGMEINFLPFFKH